MKAIVHDHYGDPSVLELREVERPEPAAGEVLVRVHAASANPLDWHMLTGTPYLVRLVRGFLRPSRITRGADLAGVVESVGEGVSTLKPGDRVFGTGQGSFAEYTISKPEWLLATPSSLSHAEAAAMPVAAITALQGLRDHAKLQPGQRVLINGAAGGVGTYAVQIALAMGAEVTAVCSTRNVEMVRGLGATRVVDYTKQDFVDGTLHDAMLDNVGNRSISDCRSALTATGTYVMVSGPKKNKWLDPFKRLIAGKIRFLKGQQRWVMFTADESSTELAELITLVDQGKLVSVIDRHYPLADTPDAIRYIATGHAQAKVIIDVSESSE